MGAWMDKSMPTRIFPSKAWKGRQDLTTSSLLDTTSETCLKRVLSPSSTDVLKPGQPHPNEDSPISSGNLFSLAEFLNRVNLKPSCKYEMNIVHVAESVTPKRFHNLQKSSTKAAWTKQRTEAHTDFSWLYLEKKPQKPTGWLTVCMGVKTNLKIVLPLRSHTKPQWLFSVSHCYNMGAFTRVSRWYSALPCSHYCAAHQLCRPVWFTHWQSLLLYLHRANLLLIAAGSFKIGQAWDFHSEIIGSVLRALSEATHTAAVGVSWGCTNPTPSYSTSLAALPDTEAILLQIFLSWHPPRWPTAKEAPT